VILIAYPSVVTYTHTATDDAAFRLIFTQLWLREANIHVATNNAKYGDLNNQDASITTSDIATFYDFNLADLYFKNATGGSNTTIYLVGVVMTEGRKRELGI